MINVLKCLEIFLKNFTEPGAHCDTDHRHVHIGFPSRRADRCRSADPVHLRVVLYFGRALLLRAVRLLQESFTWNGLVNLIIF